MVQARDALPDGARPPAAGRPLQRHRIQLDHALAVRRARAVRRRDARSARSSSSRGLRARGGTEMLPALEIALAGAREASILRQVVFLTDGAVGNEDEILKLVSRAHRRPAPLHRRHRPRAQHVLHDQGRAVRPRHVHRDRRRARSAGEDDRALPQARDARRSPTSRSTGPRARTCGRASVPDLYAGEPVVVTAQYNAGAAAATSRCRAAARARRGARCCPPQRPASEPGVGVLWARAKIDALMDAGRRGAPERRHPRGGDRRRAHAPSRQQVHEPRRRRRDADEARRDRGVQNRDSRQHSRGPDRASTSCRARPRPRRSSCSIGALDAGDCGRCSRSACARPRSPRPRSSLAIALSVTIARDAEAQTRKPKAPANLLLLPGHYDGDVGSFDPLAEGRAADRLVRARQGRRGRRTCAAIPDARGPAAAVHARARVARRSTTARRCNRRSGSSTTSTCRTPALREGPVTEVPLRRRALVPVNGRAYALDARARRRSRSPSNNGLKGRAGAHYVVEHAGERSSTCSTDSAGTARSRSRATSTATACRTSSSTSTATTRARGTCCCRARRSRG